MPLSAYRRLLVVAGLSADPVHDLVSFFTSNFGEVEPGSTGSAAA
jgi:hypothetical protein